MDLAAALAIWAEEKPDCKAQRLAISSTFSTYEFLQSETVIGITGACVLDDRGHVVTVEGSGSMHVCMMLCANPHLEKHLATRMLFSHMPCNWRASLKTSG